jgi:hypothetical protein
MTLPDENPGGFSPVSVNWVAGVSGPLTGHFVRRHGSSTERSAPASRSAVGWGGTWQSRQTGTTPEASILPTGGRQE